MYKLQVFFGGALRHTEQWEGSAEALARIPELLREHEGCDRIEVSLERTRLFSVDREGRSTPG